MGKSRDLYTRSLFEKESNLKIIRLTKDDVLDDTDNLKLLTEQIIKHETMYPNIKSWLTSKALPGLKDNSRVAYLGLENNVPFVSAILKCGIYSKFCHLHINEEARDQNIGDLFFTIMTLDAKRKAKELHFTLPEGVWSEKKGFFQSFGFQEAIKAQNQYRNSENELSCSASFDVVWKNALEKLPKIISSLTQTKDNIFSGILMSIKPEHIEKIKSRDKAVEIRKKFNKKWMGCRLTIYSSSPDRAIYGHAQIEKVEKDTPKNIWQKHGDDIGVSEKVFNDYVDSSEEIYAISLKDFEPYYNPIYISQIEGLLNYENLIPPQSYLSLENNSGWSKAVSIAELLHNRFFIYQAFA